MNQQAHVFNPTAEARFLKSESAAYSPEFFRQRETLGDQEHEPVFVVGVAMRTGTSLAHQILTRMPGLAPAGECTGMPELGKRMQYGPCKSIARSLAVLDEELANGHLAMFNERLPEKAQGARRFVDKMPLNVRYLPLIAALFPKARIVYCMRDPLDTCLSSYFCNFETPFPFTSDLKDMGKFYRLCQATMELQRKFLPLPIYTLQYERLVTDLENVSRELAEFCGAEWTPDCLRPDKNDTPVHTASMVQVRRPVYTTSVGRWRNYEKHLGPLREGLAWDPMSVR